MPVPFKKDPVEFNQRKLLAQNVFDLLEEDDDCLVYEDIFNQIDTKKIEERYSMRGQHAYHPKRIVAILIYAYSQGIFSSRQIEKKCSRDLSFMYISHRNCPNFRVLADFRKDNYKFFLECFRQSVMIAKGLGMVSLGHVSADGSKFSANTSKYKAASYSRLKANEEKLKKEICNLLKKAEKCDEKEDKIYHNGKGYSIPDELKIKGSKQISYADTQARMMKQRGNYEYCYNGQISVDSKNQIIVSQHLTQNANDKAELDRALSEIEKNTGKFPDKMSLDNGYATADNISTLSAAKIDAYIAATKGEKDKSADSSKKIGKSYFSYNHEKDTFTCPAGYILVLKYSGKNRIYRAEDRACLGCRYKDRCLYSKNNTPRLVTNRKGLLIATMVEKMKKDYSKEIYKKRKIIVEPVFGQIKTGGFRRFSLRGFKKAGGEFSLVCAASNFKKIVNMIKAKIQCLKERELLPQAV